MIRYGLSHTMFGILGFETTSNHPDCEGNDVSYELAYETGNVWMVNSKEEAEYVRTHDTPYYNAGYRTPRNHFTVSQLEVVEFHIDIKKVKEV